MIRNVSCLFFLNHFSNFFQMRHTMNLRSFIVTVIIAGSVTYLFSLVPPVDGKGGSKGSGSRPGGSRPGGSRPGSSRPTNSKPSYTPSKGVSSKGFGTKKVVAFAAGAYIGGKVAKKVNDNSF